MAGNEGSAKNTGENLRVKRGSQTEGMAGMKKFTQTVAFVVFFLCYYYYSLLSPKRAIPHFTLTVIKNGTLLAAVSTTLLRVRVMIGCVPIWNSKVTNSRKSHHLSLYIIHVMAVLAHSWCSTLSFPPPKKKLFPYRPDNHYMAVKSLSFLSVTCSPDTGTNKHSQGLDTRRKHCEVVECSQTHLHNFSKTIDLSTNWHIKYDRSSMELEVFGLFFNFLIANWRLYEFVQPRCSHWINSNSNGI